MAASLPLTPKPEVLSGGVMDMKVGSLSLCPLRKLSNNFKKERNLVSPDMTVEQYELFSLSKSYHCIQVEEIGVWPLVPKNKILASFLMAIPSQQIIGGGGCCKERTEEET